MSSTYHIAIIGPADTVSGFKALGVESFPANTAAEALEQLKKIKDITNDPENSNQYAVVCMIEDLMVSLDQAEYAKVTAGALPAVVVLPGPEGSKGFAVDRLRSLAEQAVGSAII